jgi:hypothetical protein
VAQYPVHADGGGEVIDHVHPGDEPLDQIGIQDRGVDQLELPPMLHASQVGAATRGQVVEHGHVVAAFDQPLDQVGTNETRAAGDQRALH